jgi:hypothetical protein
LKRFRANTVFVNLLVPKAGQAHDARKVMNDGIAIELGGKFALQVGEVVERDVVNAPIGVELAARAFDDNVWSDFPIQDGLNWRAVEVNKKRHYPDYVVARAWRALPDFVDGDKDACTPSV